MGDKRPYEPPKLTPMMTRDQIQGALGPLWDWYQSDEHPDRPLEDIFKDISFDARLDRSILLNVRGRLSTVLSQVRRGVATKEELEQFCEDAWAMSDRKDLKECASDSLRVAKRNSTTLHQP